MFVKKDMKWEIFWLRKIVIVKKKKKEKIVIRSDKILLNELYEKDWLWMVFLKGGMIEKLMFCF